MRPPSDENNRLGEQQRAHLVGAEPRATVSLTSVESVSSTTSLEVTSAIIEQSSDAIISCNSAGALTLMNAVARELFEIAETTPVGSVTLRDIQLGNSLGYLDRRQPHPLNLGASAEDRTEFRSVQHSAGARFVTAKSKRIFSTTGSDLGVILTLCDTTKARVADAELKSLAREDQLTGLANRRCVQERLADLAAKGGPGQLVAFFIDLDGFKAVNDIHGHKTGDALLQVAAARLRHKTRSNDLLARQGGDQFIALFPDLDSTEDAIVMADRLRAALGEPYEIKRLTFNLTASIGIAVEPFASLGEERLLQKADIALYEAKGRGRDRVELFDQHLATATALEQSRRDAVRSVLDERRLVMQFQPIVDAVSGLTVSVESLMRYRDRAGELVGPADFMDAVSSTSMMVELDRQAFDLSCAAAATMPCASDGKPIRVACNFSPTSLLHPDLVENIINTTELHGVCPSQICIEITESGAFHADRECIAGLRRLDEAGFSIALDDFGTGYSSLAHLKDLPLSAVKIDKSFIWRLTTDSPERAISRAIVRLSAELGLTVVAEGVETEDQLLAARETGFSQIQGWYYARALDLEDLHQRLDHERRYPNEPIIAAKSADAKTSRKGSARSEAARSDTKPFSTALSSTALSSTAPSDDRPSDDALSCEAEQPHPEPEQSATRRLMSRWTSK